MKKIVLQPIGTVHSPFKQPAGMPVQPRGATGIKGSIELQEQYTPGLKDLDGFSHIILLYYFHLAQNGPMVVIPYLEDKPKGIFAARMPGRPNHIGLSVVRLVKIESNIVHIENVDILDGTPLLDIKPYVTAFDVFKTSSEGWLSGISQNIEVTRSDGRFS